MPKPSRGLRKPPYKLSNGLVLCPPPGALPTSGAVNLRNCNLVRTSFAGRDVQWYDFHGSDLSYATFRGANVTGANFTDAMLQHADFSDAQGLLPDVLAGADLRGAILPSSFPLQERISLVDSLGIAASRYLFGLMTACVFAVLTIVTTPDAGFYTD